MPHLRYLALLAIFGGFRAHPSCKISAFIISFTCLLLVSPAANVAQLQLFVCVVAFTLQLQHAVSPNPPTSSAVRVTTQGENTIKKLLHIFPLFVVEDIIVLLTPGGSYGHGNQTSAASATQHCGDIPLPAGALGGKTSIFVWTN